MRWSGRRSAIQDHQRLLLRTGHRAVRNAWANTQNEAWNESMPCRTRCHNCYWSERHQRIGETDNGSSTTVMIVFAFWYVGPNLERRAKFWDVGWLLLSRPLTSCMRMLMSPTLLEAAVVWPVSGSLMWRQRYPGRRLSQWASIRRPHLPHCMSTAKRATARTDPVLGSSHSMAH